MKNARFYGNEPYKAVVVHGGPGAPGSVAAIARELGRHFGVIELLQTKNTIPELLLELDGVIKTSCTEPVILIGHSWGAWLVFMYAAGFPGMVKKIILVGSGPFEPRYVSQISGNRAGRLSEAERTEYFELLKKLDSTGEKDKGGLLKKLGRIVDKCDNYCTFEIATDSEDRLQAEGGKYTSVWQEASAMRESGELLEMAYRISCPVAAIHGRYDPHPPDGVKLPLVKMLGNFTFYLLDKCGHSPWKEKYAFQEFYGILMKETGGPENER